MRLHREEGFAIHYKFRADGAAGKREKGRRTGRIRVLRGMKMNE